MLTLHSQMRLNFAKQVKLIQQSRSGVSYVEKCKIYIGQNLNKPFTLDDIADSLKLNKRYLARLFVQDVGLTIMGYARDERIKAAANMLKFSDEKISAYCHLSYIP